MTGIDWLNTHSARPQRASPEKRAIRAACAWLCGIHLHRCVIAPGKLLPLPLSLEGKSLSSCGKPNGGRPSRIRSMVSGAEYVRRRMRE
jgi:hypothetical protein